MPGPFPLGLPQSWQSPVSEGNCDGCQLRHGFLDVSFLVTLTVVVLGRDGGVRLGASVSGLADPDCLSKTGWEEMAARLQQPAPLRPRRQRAAQERLATQQS